MHYRLAKVPLSSNIRVISPGRASGRRPVFLKLSKLLNQENALSAPCLEV